MSTLLAIDDDKATLGLLDSQLSGLGYRVFTERAAVKGIEIAVSFSPDVILLDLHMPIMDGFKVLSALKKNKITKDIPVIMLTSNKERETVVEAMRHGVVDYIVKPYNIDRLNLKIQAAINYRTSKKDYEDYIVLNRKGDITVIVMRGSLGNKEFKDDAKTVFNPFLMKQMTGKVCIFDMRSVAEMGPNDLFSLTEFVRTFSLSKLKIVAGRHYGTIVSETSLDEEVELFLSFGDLELALNTNRIGL